VKSMSGVRHEPRPASVRRAAVLGLCAVLLAASCSTGGREETARTTSPAGIPNGTGSFRLALSQGEAATRREVALAVVDGDPLSSDDIAAIVRKLPSFERGDERRTFRRPTESRERPRVGTTIDQPFGGTPRPAAEPNHDGPLEVLRFQPDGDVAIAPDLSVTFNHPMIPLATLEQLDAVDVPVVVTPELDGRWRWIGTRTLRFEYAGETDRLPMATEYTVEIPKGTRSQSGGVLAKSVRFTFRTPPPAVLEFAPGAETLDREPVFAASFDQRVDPESVIDSITLHAGEDEVDLRVATEAEIASDERVAQLVERSEPGRVVAFRPVETLPVDTRLRIAIGPGTPSGEGPRVSERASTHTARTYPPLRAVRKACGYGDGCRPGSPLLITFSNRLDAEAFDPASITIEPNIAASTSVDGNTVVISAATVADTAYRVQLPQDLRDEFGQTLGDIDALEFDVGRALPRLNPFERQLITTDPMSERASVSVTSIGHTNLQVDVYAVGPEDWNAFERFVNEGWDDGYSDVPGWDRRSSSTIEVSGGGVDLTETTIDLADDLVRATGHLVVVVSPSRDFDRSDRAYYDNRPTVAWVQTTRIGVDAMALDDELITWTTDLRDGAPLDGVTVRLAGHDAASTTDDEGLARLPIERSRYLIASHGDDRAILLSEYNYEWTPIDRADSVVGFAFTDRGLYRPGETVHVKGWFRHVDGATGALSRIAAARKSEWAARDAFGNEIGRAKVDIDANGAFDLSFDIPAGSALGFGSLNMTVNDDGTWGGAQTQFSIEEFRRPDFEVVTRTESPAPALLTAPVTLAATAQYFSGGTLPNAPTTWQVTTRESVYTPPNWSRFSFGEQQPWYWEHDAMRGHAGDFESVDIAFDEGPCCGPNVDENVFTYTGTTDATGTHYVEIDFEGERPDLPLTVSANAAIEDVNRQSFAANHELLVHPARYYVGLRTAREFVREGEAFDIEAIVTDIDGTVVDGRAVQVTIARVEQTWSNGEYVETLSDEQSCDIASESEPVSCSLGVRTGGEYRITAVVRDDDGGRNRTEITRFVAGAGAIPSRNVEQESAIVIPDRAAYEPGDTAKLLVMSPFDAGTGLMTVVAGAKAESTTFTLRDGSVVVEVAITDAHIGGAAITIDLAGQAPRRRDDGTPDPDQETRPAFASGNVVLPVDATTKQLDVEVAATETTTTPGAASTIAVEVRNPDGTPASEADVVVIVADEAVLSLIDLPTPDPLAHFHGPNAEQRWMDHLRSTLVLSKPVEVGAPNGSAPETSIAASERSFDDSAAESYSGADADTLANSARAVIRRPDRIEIRTNFDALAMFAPSLRTDATGHASIDFELPDNLTRYRVMAVVASGDDHFGSDESMLTARLPLQVRPSAPRFANFGDTFEFPVVLQNQTDEPITADVVIETVNLTLDGGAGRRVDVPPNDRIEVRFSAAVDQVGTARFRVTAASAAGNDSSEGAFPVYTPVTTEAFATYGVLDEGTIAQPLLTPAGAIEQFGGLEIDTSSTALQALTDAVVYLNDYEYESADAYASRITALTALRDVFTAFAGGNVPTAAQVDERIRADIDALVALQGDDGGFGQWRREAGPQPFVSVQATEALVLAERAGFAIPDRARTRALRYIADIERHFPPYWGIAERHSTSAYALAVRNRAGTRDTVKAEALYRSDSSLALDAIAWLWPVVDDPAIDAEIERTLRNRATETPSALTFASGYDDRAHLVMASDRRTDGIVLDALVSQRPDSDMIPKVVTGLIGSQTNGRWNNVQENGFILVALQRYFATFESQTPDFVARVWLGDSYAAEHAYTGRSTDYRHTVVPMTELGGDPEIVIQNDGTGRLYYRLGLRYAPDDLALAARDEGFVVVREYEAVDDPSDVTRDADGTWRIEPGAMVRVKLTMVADSSRTNMVLVDPLPAGLEAVNPALAASPRPPAELDGEEGGDSMPMWWGYTWFDHENLRDDRVEAYSAYLVGGTYEYTYVARATTVGEFVVPPTKAEQIYAPEVFGRSSTDRVVVG
jgi:alpha-2-macroglobulin